MSVMLDIKIVDLLNTDSEEFLEILWTALNPDGVIGRTRDILNDPIIKAYYENWGSPDDIGFAAIDDGKLIGAIWCRIKNCVTDTYSNYPELCIGVLPNYQNKGVGSLLLKTLINASSKKYPGLRLGVNEKAKRVILFYSKYGFVEYDKYKGAPQLQLTF